VILLLLTVEVFVVPTAAVMRQQVVVCTAHKTILSALLPVEADFIMRGVDFQRSFDAEVTTAGCILRGRWPIELLQRVRGLP
jgi:hypothetical protein